MRRRNDPTIQELVDLPLWSGIRHDDAKELLRHADEVRLPAGKVLCREGGRSAEVFVILDGTVEATHDDRVLGTAGPGGIVGEMGLLDGEPRSADVRAVTDVRALVLGIGDFRVTLAEVPGFTRQVMKELVARQRQLQPQPS
jgi:CRP-like cAMP-binding protein